MARHNYIPKNEIKALAKPSDVAGWLLVLHGWGTIALMMAMFVYWPNILTFFIAFWVISGRQLGLAILMHEASHGMLFKSEKLNAVVGQYPLASIIGADLAAYRKYHLKHHLHTQQAKDPDLGLAAAFPVNKASFTRKVLRDLTGITGMKLRIAQFMLLFRKNNDAENPDQAFSVKNSLLPYIMNFALFLICYVAGYWWLYFVLWLFPLLTGFQLVLRIRNIAEHAMVSQDDNPLTHARTTTANWFARILVAPYWVNFHIEHHAYMYIPCWQLKNLHKAMAKHGHLPDMEMKDSYTDVLRMAVSG